MKIIDKEHNIDEYNKQIKAIVERLIVIKSKLDGSIDSLELSDEIDEIIEGLNGASINDGNIKIYIKYAECFIIFNFMTYNEAENEYCENIITISKNWDFIQNHMETKECTTITKFILKDGKTIYDLYIDNRNSNKSLI